MHSLGQESQQLQDITNKMAMYIPMDTLEKNIDEDKTVASVHPATIVTQKPTTKAVAASNNKPAKPATKKPLLKEKALLYDKIYDDVQTHLNEYRASHPNTDIYQQAYLIRLEQLLMEIKDKRNTNDYRNMTRTNWQVEYLRNKFDMIQSKYKPE